VAVSGHDHEAAVERHAAAMAEARRIKLSPWTVQAHQPPKKSYYVKVATKKKCVSTGKRVQDKAAYEATRRRVCELYFEDEMRVSDIASLLDLRRTYVSTVLQRARRQKRA
jgi:hypothetical protein